MSRVRKQPGTYTISSLNGDSLGSKKRKRVEVPSVESTPRSKQKVERFAETTRSPRSRLAATDVQVKEQVENKAESTRNGSLILEETEEVKISVKKSPALRLKTQKASKADPEDEQDLVKEETQTKAKRKGKPKQSLEEEGDEDETKPKKKRKTKEEKEAEAMALAARTTGLKMFVGAHTSVAKGVENSVMNCLHIGGNAFACFLKSQRKWENPPLQNSNRDAFRKALIEHKYDGMKHVVPHGSYLVNLANADKDKVEQSYDAFLDDLRRCEALGIKHYNFHPGGAGTGSFDEAIKRLAGNLNRALSETSTVVLLLENMAGHGTLIGGRFSDLRDVIAQIKPEFRPRIGVCIDTCHAFAAGYDLRTPEAFEKTMQEFDDVVGMQYLKALHLNDSKAPLNSHRDLHQNIGLGFLGLRAFHSVMNEPRFQGLPLILETPSERPDPKDPTSKKTIEDKSVWAKEIKLLESLIGMDPKGDEFLTLERELSNKGKKERQEMQAKFDEKQEKERKKMAKERERGQKSLTDMFGKVGGGQANKVARKTRKKPKGQDESDSDELSSVGDLSDNEEGHKH
ncbi:AP endonuclease 1 [Exophiala aquamarina CBS 119918]|uniref:Apurinic-apyrimidinic endonuclease 1 n=1 Tax=Exophiala aquamarina CBS 119918 TaxID=1182545 RepID=A0A072NYS6_9EURO|nr:AP endonuclease 1 [Exophiala aquamarina CBS 119918]KEF52173.1 AP endonuclease 1 [Exophiala aquamarina CBS 119918]